MILKNSANENFKQQIFPVTFVKFFLPHHWLKDYSIKNSWGAYAREKKIFFEYLIKILKYLRKNVSELSHKISRLLLTLIEVINSTNFVPLPAGSVRAHLGRITEEF